MPRRSSTPLSVRLVKLLRVYESLSLLLKRRLRSRMKQGTEGIRNNGVRSLQKGRDGQSRIHAHAWHC